jgi:hypothetical protein
LTGPVGQNPGRRPEPPQRAISARESRRSLGKQSSTCGASVYVARLGSLKHARDECQPQRFQEAGGGFDWAAAKSLQLRAIGPDSNRRPLVPQTGRPRLWSPPETSGNEGHW